MCLAVWIRVPLAADRATATGLPHRVVQLAMGIFGHVEAYVEAGIRTLTLPYSRDFSINCGLDVTREAAGVRVRLKVNTYQAAVVLPGTHACLQHFVRPGPVRRRVFRVVNIGSFS